MQVDSKIVTATEEYTYPGRWAGLTLLILDLRLKVMLPINGHPPQSDRL